MPSISSLNLKLRNGSVRCGMSGSSLTLRLGRVLEHAEDHEFRRPDRGNADLANEPAVQDVVLRHRRAIAGDEERLVLGPAVERAAAPLRPEEQADGVLDARPQAIVV